MISIFVSLTESQCDQSNVTAPLFLYLFLQQVPDSVNSAKIGELSKKIRLCPVKMIFFL